MTISTQAFDGITFGDMARYLGQRDSRTITNNTEVTNVGGDILVSLHGHAIARVTPDHIKVSSCRYRTVTTKHRLNCLLKAFGFRVVQRAGTWYIESLPGAGFKQLGTFVDGMTIYPDGSFYTPEQVYGASV